MIRAVVFDMYETLITLFDSPLYFGTQMAADAEIPVERFREVWDAMESDRTIGKVTLEETVEAVLRKNQRYSKELQEQLVAKRTAAKETAFEHLHPEILSMLEQLKSKGIKIGLISNCFSEEAYVIRKSVLYPYFDAAMLSYEQGIKKPDVEIFRRCMDQLSVDASECLYVGDGGSQELETARSLGMNAVQAVWYLKEGTSQPTGRKQEFVQLESPLDVVKAAE